MARCVCALLLNPWCTCEPRDEPIAEMVTTAPTIERLVTYDDWERERDVDEARAIMGLAPWPKYRAESLSEEYRVMWYGHITKLNCPPGFLKGLYY